MELARNRNDDADHQRMVTEMETRFPQSQWLAEALFSSGNMYMLKHAIIPRRWSITAIWRRIFRATRMPRRRTGGRVG